MNDSVYSTLAILFLSILIAYLLGSIPFAYLISRLYGVNILATGSGLAGAANVLRSVGRFPAILVFFGDIVKGWAAVMVARSLGVDSPWILAPASAAIFGHWKPLFTRFQGGDGLTTLGGVTIGMFPILGLLSASVAAIVVLGAQRLPYTSLLCIVFGLATLTVLNVLYKGDTVLALGTCGLGCLVMAYAQLGHWRRKATVVWWDEPETERAPQQAK